MTAKKNKPVLPKERVKDDLPPENIGRKWNIKYSDGDLVMDMLDDEALPLQEFILPKKKKKDK